MGQKNWGNIAQFVSGRTKEQCTERWKNCLDPSLKRGKWSEDEDSRLKAAIAKHGHRWSMVAACVPPRTDSQCLRRWKLLYPNEVPLYQAARKIRKAALISNFVDRESKRPALGPNDFAPLKMIDLPETEDIESPRKRKSRSKRPRKEAQIRPKGALRLNDGSEVINFSGDDGISRKKRGRKVSLNDKFSSIRDLVPPAPDTMLLPNTNGEELGADGGDIAMKKKDSGRRKKRGRRKSDEADATSRKVSFPMKKRTRRPRSWENEGSDPTNQNVGDLGRDEATKNRKAKASKLPSRKNRCTEQLHEVQLNTISDEVEAFGGEDTISTHKHRKIKLRSKKKKGDPIHSHSSAFPNSSFPVVFGEGVEPVGMNDTSPNTSLERTDNGDTVETFEGDNNDARSPRCSTPDISDSWNSKIFSVCRQNKFIGTRSRRKTCSNQTPNTENGDDMTLASFIKQSRKSQKSKSSSVTVSKLLNKCGNSTKMSDGSQNIALQPRCSTSEIGLIENSSASVVGAHKGRKRLRIRSKICSDQMSGAEDEDDMTLASYCTRLKKRKLEVAKNCEDAQS